MRLPAWIDVCEFEACNEIRRRLQTSQIIAPAVIAAHIGLQILRDLSSTPSATRIRSMSWTC